MTLFFLAIAFDVLGLIVLFVGIFANLRIDDRFYGDFLIYSGSLIIFSSLACWLMWYVGNIQAPEETFDGSSLKTRNSFVQLARKLSERLTQTLKPAVPSTKCAKDEDDGHVALPAHKATRVTWGKSDGYLNEGYDDSLDPFPQDKKKKRSELPNNTDGMSTLTGNIERLL